MTPSFLQAHEWEELQRAAGKKTQRVGDVLLIQHQLPGGMHYLYCPRPALSDRDGASRDDFFSAARALALNKRSVFLRIDPQDALTPPPRARVREFSGIQPRQTQIVSLRKSGPELLGAMHAKTRYNIGLAERKGVTVVRVETRALAQYQNALWSLLQETSLRDGFLLHARGYYEALLRPFAVPARRFSNELFFAEHRGTILAAALVNFYAPSRTATYLHGASRTAERNLMGSYLLQWRVIEEAQRRGFWYYDLWGSDEDRWPGVTRFKRGFGGVRVTHPSAIDIIYRPLWYRAYRAGRALW